MTRIEGRTTFTRTREDVFDFLADPRNEPSYNPLIISARKATPGPVGPGSRFTQQTKTLGRVSDVTIDLLEYHRPDHLSWHITSSGMDVHGREELTATPEATEVHWVWEFAARGPLRLLGPLVGLGGRRLERRVWSDMQRALNATTPDDAVAGATVSMHARPGTQSHPAGGGGPEGSPMRSGMSATRITVTALGLLAAAVGIEHGLGAIAQGTGAPPGLVFQSWPDAPSFESLDGEPALTLVPDLLATGILAVLTSVAIGIWTVWGARHPRWGLGLLVLSALLLLCGGGFGPPLLGTVAGLLATRAAHTWSTPGGHVTRVAARLWPWPLVVAVASFLTLVPGLQVLYAVRGPVGPELVGLLMVTAFTSTAVAVVVARARDRVAGEPTPRDLQNRGREP